MLNILMWDNSLSGFFYVEGFGEGTEYTHLCDGVLITEVVLKVIIFETVCGI